MISKEPESTQDKQAATCRATTGAARIAKLLRNAGIRRVFSLSGNQIMALYDAFIDAEIAVIHVRHEAAAVHMADGWARATGEPGVALVTAGPGHANAISALYTALGCQSPVIMLSGHSPVLDQRPGHFQQMDQAALARPVTKAAWTPHNQQAMVQSVANALALCAAPTPGPVQVNLPVDLLESTGEAIPVPATPLPLAAADNASIERAAALLNNAQKPLIIAGPSASRGTLAEALRALSQGAAIPYIVAESPCGLRDPAGGLLTEVLGEADTVMLAAKPLDFTLGYGASPPFAHTITFIPLAADPDAVRSARSAASEHTLAPLLGDPLLTVKALTEASVNNTSNRHQWCTKVQEALSFRPPHWQQLAGETVAPLHPPALFDVVQTVMDQTGPWTLVSDGGEVGQWAQALLKPTYKHINGPSGSIGSALPIAIACALAQPDIPTIAVMGDGTFGFHMAEVDTAVRCNARPIVIVANDARWNAEHQIQINRFGSDRLIGCQLQATRYDRCVEPFGALALHAEDKTSLRTALQRALAHTGPVCINVTLDGWAAPNIAR